MFYSFKEAVECPLWRKFFWRSTTLIKAVAPSEVIAWSCQNQTRGASPSATICTTITTMLQNNPAVFIRVFVH